MALQAGDDGSLETSTTSPPGPTTSTPRESSRSWREYLSPSIQIELTDEDFSVVLHDFFTHGAHADDRASAYRFLLAARDECTRRLGIVRYNEDDEEGIDVRLLLARARVYEALGYYELGLADAYVGLTLCEVGAGAEEESDLRPVGVDGDAWDGVRRDVLAVLVRCACLLGCTAQVGAWVAQLSGESGDWGLEVVAGFQSVFEQRERGRLRALLDGVKQEAETRFFGASQRVIYPWNTREPERMSDHSLAEINARLAHAAPKLEARTSVLPALAEGDGQQSAQLGLFAKSDLLPGETVLVERSALTGIRPHGEALCDACAADMEGIPSEERRACQGCGLPFCSEECYRLATELYHAENVDDEETDEGYPPADAPFCPGTVANEDIHTLGRAESSTTPEWDLYFLLLTRAMQMAETQAQHPLDLFDVKFLWGDFSSTAPTSAGAAPPPAAPSASSLPFSLRHHVELPLQWFEVLMHSRPACRPYSAHWLAHYDWWVVQTLFAKFRGVADAQLSTWTGQPEVSGVHPLWCLANHSCRPNVTWRPSGVRNLTVVEEEEEEEEEAHVGSPAAGRGIAAGEEVWNHYTDVQERDPHERRARLRAVLGGDCRCPRCVAETSAG